MRAEEGSDFMWHFEKVLARVESPGNGDGVATDDAPPIMMSPTFLKTASHFLRCCLYLYRKNSRPGLYKRK